jgi:hypothetical protein
MVSLRSGKEGENYSEEIHETGRVGCILEGKDQNSHPTLFHSL